LNKVAAVFASVALLALTGCSASTSPQAAAHSPAPTVAATSDASPAQSDVVYALGAPSAHPGNPCSLAAANWTAANGPVWVSVMVAGQDAVTFDVTLKSGAHIRDAFTIPGGQDTHIFVLKTVNPSSVAKVLVTAAGNAAEHGGSCLATGSPTA
jgi:ABC-type glycerol-3-phosphate transport system substrate-binding protein